MPPAYQQIGVDVSLAFLKGATLYGVPATVVTRSLRGHMRRSLAFGCFFASFRAIYRLLMRKREELPAMVDRYAEAISAGAAVVLLLRLDPSLTEYTFVSSYLAIRAARLLAPESCSGPHVAVGATCLSTAQLISSWALAPADLGSGIRKSLNKRFEITDRHTWRRELTMHLDTCKAIHPDRSSVWKASSLFVSNFRRGLRLYGIFAVVHTLRGLSQQSLNIPVVLQMWLRSSFYYATFLCVAMSSICFANSVTPGRMTRAKLFLHCWVTGLSLFVESPKNRPDQAAFLGSYALDSFWRMLKRQSGLDRFLNKHAMLHHNLCVLVWTASLSILAHRHANLLAKFVGPFQKREDSRDQQ